MSQGRIACTLALLTHDSAASLPKALANTRDFAEILVCDGNSSDRTLEIAALSGARIIAQDPRYLHPDGRIADFAGVRNQTLAASTQPWFFFLDSDEYLSEELIAAIRRIALGEASGAYWVSRKYVVEGAIVECATTYPNYSMRLFARASIEQFIKPVHERIKLKEGVIAQHLDAPLYVPTDLSWKNNLKKDNLYLALEAQRTKDMPLGTLVRGNLKTIAISGLYLLRLIRIYLFCRGQKMPFSNELSRHHYHARLIGLQWRGWLRRQLQLS